MEDRVRHLDCHIAKKKANCCTPSTLANGEAAYHSREGLQGLTPGTLGKQPLDLCLGSSLANGPKKEKTWPAVSISPLKINPLAGQNAHNPGEAHTYSTFRNPIAD